MPTSDWELAEINVARLRAPIDDPLIAEFRAALDEVNELADASVGFRWRLQTEDGNATSVRPYEDESIIINVSTWTSVEALADYVYRSDHTAFLRRRAEWFERLGEVAVAMWWVPAGTRPTVEDALARLDHLRAHGPSPHAFTFRTRFAPGSAEAVPADARDACSA